MPSEPVPLYTPPAPAPRRDWRAVWALLLALPVLAELVALGSPKLGDTLTESTRWAMGSPDLLRWWLVECGLAVLGVWLVLHFANPDDWGWRQLGVLALSAILAAVGLWLIRP